MKFVLKFFILMIIKANESVFATETYAAGFLVIFIFISNQYS